MVSVNSANITTSVLQKSVMWVWWSSAEIETVFKALLTQHRWSTVEIEAVFKASLTQYR